MAHLELVLTHATMRLTKIDERYVFHAKIKNDDTSDTFEGSCKLGDVLVYYEEAKTLGGKMVTFVLGFAIDIVLTVWCTDADFSFLCDFCEGFDLSVMALNPKVDLHTLQKIKNQATSGSTPSTTPSGKTEFRGKSTFQEKAAFH